MKQQRKPAARGGDPSTQSSAHTAHRGIVHPLADNATPHGGDVNFPADYTVTNTKDNGGRVLTDVEVIVCFWGSFWSTNPAPTPSSAQYLAAFTGIVTGPYMGKLRQYRGVGQGSIIYSEINDATSPVDLYTDANVVTMLNDRIANHGMPAPTAGRNRFYAVVVPVGIRNSLTQFAGQHQSFAVNGVTAYYAWIDNTGSLTNGNSSTKVFSHELVEAVTNPDVDTSNNSILIDGTRSNGTAVVNDEIGDTCNSQWTIADMNGITCSVQSYWSGSDTACILPLGTSEFWVDKNTFGKNEVQDVISVSAGKWEKAFWVVVDGFSKNSFNALHVTVPTPTGSFANITGVTISPNGDIAFESGVDPAAQQRVRVAFDISFTSAALSSFPSSGGQTYQLSAVIATDGNRVAGSDSSTLFELVAGADPYFTNVDPTQNNVFYLSQDLRVFTATPGQNQSPVAGAPAFSNDSTSGAFTYLQQLLAWLNSNYSNVSGPDPFNSVLPGQGNALQADSSVTPFTLDFSNFPNFHLYKNYSFAIARVRLRGSSGPSGQATNVKVFFRMWTTQSPDTDFQPATTYLSTPDSAGQPGAPLVGAGHVTLPFFATGGLTSNTDYAAGGVNNRDLEIAGGSDAVWAYFGCFLNLYDSSNVIDGQPVQAWLNGTHHCIVAQIAFDDTPLFTGATPEASDKLAQRNLQVTHSDNPGGAATHRVPQTFDIRPSLLAARKTDVDELMIDWGAVPRGSVASIYWPQVQAADVLALASALYPAHELTASDPNTVQCRILGGVTYVPIPAGTGENLASLFTIDVPTTVVTGQEFNVTVRRVGRRGGGARGVVAALPGNEPSATQSKRSPAWRYVIGTFQVKIPVTTGEVMLRPDEDTLAIMRWRLLQMTPTNRWFPVLKRYVSYIADRITGLGGDPGAIPPSPDGAPVRLPRPCDDVVEFTGKVLEVVFGCFGDFDGFVLDDCCARHVFRSREDAIRDLVLRACRDRLVLTVKARRTDRGHVQGLVIRS